MRFYRDAEWLTYFVPMPLLISGKCQAWKNSYLYNCERITCMYNTIHQDFDWALRGAKKGSEYCQGTAPEADPDNHQNSPGVLPVRYTANDKTPQQWW